MRCETGRARLAETVAKDFTRATTRTTEDKRRPTGTGHQTLERHPEAHRHRVPPAAGAHSACPAPGALAWEAHGASSGRFVGYSAHSRVDGFFAAHDHRTERETAGRCYLRTTAAHRNF